MKSENLIFSKLLSLFYISKNATKLTPLHSHSQIAVNWFPYLYSKNPLNLLFSHDQFLNEFFLKYPQRKKMSEFKLQLKEQKKLSLFYGGLSKKQLQKYFVESTHSQGEFSKKFISLVERRLDVILFRSKFVKNIAMARQLVTHKKVFVNQKIVSIPSSRINPGDSISIPHFKSLKLVQPILQELKYQNLSRSEKESHFKDWNFRSKFVSKKHIQVFVYLLLKKISLRAKIQATSNPFWDAKTSNSQFYIYRMSEGGKLSVSEIDLSRKILFKLLSSFHLDDLSKQIFFMTLQKNFKKNFSKNTILSNLNVFGRKPLHLESSYKIFTTIFLYSPQRIYYPFLLDFDLLSRTQF